MLTEVIDLSTGFGVAFLPALLLAVPCIVLVVVPSAILLLVLAAPFVVLAAPPYLLARWLRRRHDRAARRALRPAEHGVLPSWP
jgi:hypothetical protein